MFETPETPPTENEAAFAVCHESAAEAPGVIWFGITESMHVGGALCACAASALAPATRTIAASPTVTPRKDGAAFLCWCCIVVIVNTRLITRTHTA